MNTRASFYDVSSFYNKKAVLKAGYKGMRYQVSKYSSGEEGDDTLRVYIWSEPFCFEKTPDEFRTVKDFPYSEEGLDEAYEWVCSMYDSEKERWDKAMANPLVVAKEMGLM